ASTRWPRTIPISSPTPDWFGSGCERASDMAHPIARRTFMKIGLYGLVLCVAAATCPIPASAAAPAGSVAPRPPIRRLAAPKKVERDSQGAKPARLQQVSSTEVLDSPRRIDINSINMYVTNFGTFANEISTQNAGLFFPKGTIKTAVYQSGPWFVGKVGNEVR